MRFLPIPRGATQKRKSNKINESKSTDDRVEKMLF